MPFSRGRSVSRRSFCLCCVGAAAYTATGEWLTPSEAFAEARGLVSLFKDSAAVSPITTHKLRDNISVLEGSGGNIAVLTGPDGKVLIDGGIGASRRQLTKALEDLGADPITHLVNTHWHFDHSSSNEWLHGAGVSNKAELKEFCDMLVAVRESIAKLKQQGRSRDEIVAAKPTAAFDAKRGNFPIDPGFFTRLVYAGV
jgi:glyoxylase-like metal-dependent hydrolase (beta-lactamase superfamily II)